MPKQTILVVEDEDDIQELITYNLEKEGYRVRTVSTGEQALAEVQSREPDLILLDLMLPGMDGMEVCQRLKENSSKTPIIMLTARGSESDKVEGLETGADDYITKPFSLKELLARINAILRRTSVQQSRKIHEFSFGDVSISFDRYAAEKAGTPLELSPREYEMMRLFIELEGETVTREQFLEQVWGYTTFPNTRTVDNHVAKLRQKIEDDPESPQHIITVHRMGYKFLR